MLYSKETIGVIRELLEEEEFERVLVRLNEKLNKKLSEVAGDDTPELFEIIEEGLKSFEKPAMFISRAKIGESEARGYAIEFENHEGEIVVDSAYRFDENGKISTSIIDKLRNMAYMGYELHQGRENSIKEVFKF